MLFDDTYKTIAASSEGTFKDRGSKFLAFAFPLKNENEVKVHVADLRKEHHSARHHCFAFRLGQGGEFFRVNDDGEPSGTAGKPILGQLQSRGVTNVLVIVVRYFGGTLLGVSGLINAYKNAAADALDNAQIIEKHVTEVYRLTFPYSAMNDVMKILKGEYAEQWEQDFSETCSLRFSVRKNDADRVCEALKKNEGVETEWVETV